MNKSILTFLIVLTIVSIISVIVLGSRNQRNKQITTESNTYFYGDTCPHCKELEAWMEENKIEEKLTIVKKDVYNNKQNALELSNVAASCNIPANSIGVPFFYAEGECYIGTPDIQNYLISKVGQ